VTDDMRATVADAAATVGRVHVVVIGAGFGGIRVAKGLSELDVHRDGALCEVAVTVIDANNFHTFQPLLYQVATAGLDSDDVCFPVRAIIRQHRSTRFVLGSIRAVDLAERTVTIDDGRCIDYDYLVVAAGSVSADFGIAGVDAHTFALKTIHDALAVRDHLVSRFEVASCRPPGTVDLGMIVVGGGPTGVEMAGSLRELIDKVLRRDFPEFADDRVPITVVEAADRVLGPFHPSLSERARRSLVRRGVDVETGVGVDHVEHEAVVLADGRRLTAGTIVWAAGVKANPIASLLGVELGRGDRIPVGADLSLAEHPEVFAIGDIALSPTADGRPLPQVAQPAIQGGKHVALQIAARIEGRPTSPFVYKDKGSMATIGRHQAVTEFPNGLRFHGVPGWLMWLGLHIVYLMGFRNRANVLVNWAWNYVTYDHGSRNLILDGGPSADDRQFSDHRDA
jgi:NADH dehydrogenase